jgi:hypothetical protein
MGNHGPVDGLPGIDVEIPGFAVKTAISKGEKGHDGR